MVTALQDIILEYIDDALDVDDLEEIGDYVRSVILAEGINEWQTGSILKQLHADLFTAMVHETNIVRKHKIKAGLGYFEADFSDLIIAKEIESISES